MADTLVNTSKYWIEHFEEEAWWRGVPALFKFSGADEIKGLLILIDFGNRNTELLLLFSIISPWFDTDIEIR